MGDHRNTMHKSSLKVFLQVMAVCFGAFFFGYSLGVYNNAKDTMHTILGLTENLPFYDGLISSLIPAGALVGAISSGIVLDKFSRKNALIITDLIGLVGVGLSLIASVPIFCFSRFFMGIATGLNSALVPLYIKEISPISISGSMGSFNQFMINVGITISYLWGLGFDNSGTPSSTYWRVVFGFPIATCLLRIILLVTIYSRETPLFYL